MLKFVDEDDGDLLPLGHIGHVRAEQCVEAEADGFALKNFLALRDGELPSIRRGSHYLDAVLVVEHGRPDDEFVICGHCISFSC